jgi:hypothetical protein
MRPEARAELARVAVAHGGAFMWGDAMRAGWTAREARAARDTGEWRRLGRGTFVDRIVWEALRDDRQQHLCVVRGRLLHKTPVWHAARRSSAVVHGLPFLGSMPIHAQLLRGSNGGTSKARNRHERTATVLPQDITRVNGVACSSLARTVVDLGRSDSRRSALTTTDAALRQGLTHAELMAVVERCLGWPGGPHARWVAHFADGLAESPLESISRLAMHQLGLPAPELQVEVWCGRELIARVDHLWRESNTIGQADGAMKYASRTDVLHDKRQDERLENLGFEVVRWGWDEAWRGGRRFEEVILRALGRGSRQELDPTVRLVSTSIQRNHHRAA